MYTNDRKEHNIVEEDIGAFSLFNNYTELIKHPNTGFPKALNRNNKTNKQTNEIEVCNIRENVDNSGDVLENSLEFNFTINDILKLRWTNPIGEDKEDLNCSKKPDNNLHSLRFDFEGNICDNTDVERKIKDNDLYFYKGLHHHSEQGEFEGYTIPELMHLSRSSNVSQRCISIRTLGNIFLMIRRYNKFSDNYKKSYQKYLLGYLFGINRWYKYLTDNLSIHYLLLNMLFHESYTSRTAEHCVISLSNLFCGNFFPLNCLKRDNSMLFCYFLTPCEFIFEMMNERMNYFPFYIRNHIIYQKLDFIDKIRSFSLKNERYDDLNRDDHLIKFEVPDGRTIELIRDILQEVYLFKPMKYDQETETGRNSLIYFLCKMSESRNGSTESRISSLKLITLFIQRECINDTNICFFTLRRMIENIAEELFEFVASELSVNTNSNIAELKLLFIYLYFIRVYTQALYNKKMVQSNNIKDQRDFLTSTLIKFILQIIRIIIISFLKTKMFNSNEFYEIYTLCFIEGLRIIGIVIYNNIFAEDLSIYCKELIYFFSAIQRDNMNHSNLIYHLFMLGYYILLSSEDLIEQEYIHFIKVLHEFIPKYFKNIRGEKLKLSNNSILLNDLLVSISIIRFQKCFYNKIKTEFKYDSLNYYLEFHLFYRNYLEELTNEEFNLNILTLENGISLEIQMGLTSTQDLLNNELYHKYYSLVLITTYLREISSFLIKLNQNEVKQKLVEIIKPNFNIIMSFYEKHSNIYNIQKHSSFRFNDSVEGFELYNYELCYFEMLYINDDNSSIKYNNIIKKNSLFLQILNSNLIYLLIITNLNIYSGEFFFANQRSEISIVKDIPIINFESMFEIKDHNIAKLYDYFLLLLFNNKNLEEYALVLYFMFKISNYEIGIFDDFYKQILIEYSDFFDESYSLIFNPFIYSLNIFNNSLNKLKRSNDFKHSLLNIFKKIFYKRSFENNSDSKKIIFFISRYIFEYSINRLFFISKMENNELEDSEFDQIGNEIFDHLKISLELICTDNFKNDIINNFENMLDILDVIIPGNKCLNRFNQTLYDINNEEDNIYIQKLIDVLISSFCNSNIYFSNYVSDCFYFLFIFILINLGIDSSSQLKILSNMKILKFLLFYKNEGIKWPNYFNFILINTNKEIEDISNIENIIDIISENVYLYKEVINSNILGILILIYYNNVIKWQNSNFKKTTLIKKITKFWEETKIEALNKILVNLIENK